jgi:uncharacterized membrane protein YqiK
MGIVLSIIGVIIFIFLAVGMTCLYCQADNGEAKKVIFRGIKEGKANGKKRQKVVIGNTEITLECLIKNDCFMIREMMSQDELEDLAHHLLTN